MRVLVTGGTGFIGRRLMARLLDADDVAAIACLALPPATAEEQALLDRFAAQGVQILQGDLNDPGVSACPPPRVDVVMHLAANIDTAAREADLRVNDLGTEHLLNWLRPVSAGVRILYTSSVAVLDRAAPAAGPLTETSPCTPRTAYGETKLGGEHVLQARTARDGFSYTIVRLGTIYGPGAKPGGLFESLCRMTASDSLLARLNWPGRVSVMHVDDVADVLYAAAHRPEAANEIYCVANPDAPTVSELAERIGAVSGHPVRAVRLSDRSWSLVRSVIWNPAVRLTVGSVAAQTFWRFTLLVDHAFWLDTAKMRAIWSRTPVDLDTGLRQMIASLHDAGSAR